VFTARTGTSNCVGERIDSTQKPGLLFTIDDSRSKPVIIPALAPRLGRLWYGRDRKGKKGWHRWQLFKETEPGHRFYTHYNSRRQRRKWGETSPSTGGSSTSSAGSRSSSRGRVPAHVGSQLHHHCHRVEDARRRTPAPHLPVRPGRREAERIGAVDQSLMDQLVYRGEGPIALFINAEPTLETYCFRGIQEA
jgi:hypothetical protein